MTVSFATMMGQTPAHCAEISSEGGSAICQRASESQVGQRLPRAFDDPPDVSLMSDTELQARIDLCALQMLAANALGMKDERRRWCDEEARALRERNRRPHLVAAREAQIEARMAAEPGMR